jgi:Uma2 family endonuclease
MVATKRITVDDLERAGVPDGFWELVDGRIVEVAPAGGEASSTGMIAGYYLMGHVMPHELGRVYGADGGFVLFPGEERELLRAPDVAFVRADRVPPPAQHARFLRLPPDLVVEVVSPSDGQAAVAVKAALWIEGGVRLVWVADPASRTVDVWESGRSVRTLGVGDELDGGDVLPGFRLPIAELFR